MWFLKSKHERPSESSAKIKEYNEDGFFAALISPLINDIKEKNIEARTITVKQKGDAQIIILDTPLEAEDAFDKILSFLGNRLDPATVGKDILAIDTLVERIFVRKPLSEPIEYPIFDESGKTSQTAVLKNPVVIVARKGLRTLTKKEERKTSDKMYIPIRVEMPKELKDKLVNSLYMHSAANLLTKAGVIKHIGVNPDTKLMEVVISQLVPGYPSPSPDIHDIKAGEMFYIWLEVMDRKYYNKILTQIYEIINNFAIKEMKNDTSDFELQIEIKPAVFMTRMEIGGELCSQIMLNGTGYLFTSLQGINKVMLPAGKMSEIASMGITLKPNSDL
ncbi:MAG: hypothetical protein OI715_00205 (plasmid) [Candidatus Methanoperedens sp.]|nr:MAG: hypothetical protein OI715_00205 [Candidatus Methanoperedens sp.]